MSCRPGAIIQQSCKLLEGRKFWSVELLSPLGSVRLVCVVDVMADKELRYGLKEQSFSAVAHWAYADGTLERSWDEIVGTSLRLSRFRR